MSLHKVTTIGLGSPADLLAATALGLTAADWLVGLEIDNFIILGYLFLFLQTISMVAYLQLVSRMANVEQATMGLMNRHIRMTEELPKKIMAHITEKIEEFTKIIEFHNFEQKMRYETSTHEMNKKLDELKQEQRCRFHQVCKIVQEHGKELKSVSNKLDKVADERKELEERLIEIENKLTESLGTKMDCVTRKLEEQQAKLNHKLIQVDGQLEVFTKYLEENSSGLKLICTRFDQSTFLDASLDIKLDSSLVCIRSLSNEIEKLKATIAGYNEKQHNKKGSYENWDENKHDNLLQHHFLPCDVLLSCLGEFLMKEDEPDALSELEKSLEVLKYKCVKVNNKTRFPNDGALYADLDDTPMSITFHNFVEAIRTHSTNIGKPYVSLMIKTLTESHSARYGIYDCKTFEQRYGLIWSV